MSSKAVQDKFNAYMLANWTDTDIYDVNNTIDAPPRDDLSDWIAIQYPGAGEEQVSMGDPGNNVWREEGVIVIHIQTASGIGNQEFLTIGEKLSNMLRAAVIDGIHIRSVSPPNFREDVKAFQGNWYSMTTALDYYHDIHA